MPRKRLTPEPIITNLGEAQAKRAIKQYRNGI